MLTKYYICTHPFVQMLKFLWDGYQTSQAYGLSFCHEGEDTASVSSFVDDLKTTTHGLKDTHVETHEMMGSNMILVLKGLREKVSKKNVILSTKNTHGLKLAKHYARHGVSTSVKPSAKYLGLGTTGGVRRTTATIKDRIRSARPRNNKVAWLHKGIKKPGRCAQQVCCLRLHMGSRAQGTLPG